MNTPVTPPMSNAPVDIILHCPACHAQHIDAPETHRVMVEGQHVDNVELWTNPPHRSHLCHACGNVWRPSDRCTNGVASIATRGKADRPERARLAAQQPAPLLVLNGHQLREALDFLAPDGTDEQLEQAVCIQHGPGRTDEEGEDEAAGLYCWLEEYPEEGSTRLDEEPAHALLFPSDLHVRVS